VVRRDAETFSASANVGNIVDTTGAGDSATGTYLAHRLLGADIETALHYAMAAAARVVQGLGSRG
jgi:sugar/nucleoside kinase (ribokinase family)